MKKKTIILFCVLGLIMAVSFAGCSRRQGNEPAPSADNAVKIALIIENTIDDKGWCQSMHDGITEAQQRLPGRIQYSYSENMPPVNADSAVRQYVKDGYHIIIGHGAQYKNFILGMAEEFPDVTFAFGTSAEIGPANVFTYMPESEETGYLNGIIAGLTTKSNIVGYVGPVDGGDAARYGRGFILGVQSVNPAATVYVDHVGSYSDFVKSGEVAHSQISRNADVLTGAAQQAIGALRAVGEAQYGGRYLWWVGQEIVQFETPEGQARSIAAAAYNYAAVIVGLVEKFDSGIRGGECIPMNFNNSGFFYEFNNRLSNMAPADVRAKVEEAMGRFRARPQTLNWSAVDYSDFK